MGRNCRGEGESQSVYLQPVAGGGGLQKKNSGFSGIAEKRLQPCAAESELLLTLSTKMILVEKVLMAMT